MDNKKLSGQLWEECPLCGQEPIYMSNGGYCEKCGKNNNSQIPFEEIETEIYGDEYDRR
jgi:hypothetical protein